MPMRRSLSRRDLTVTKKRGFGACNGFFLLGRGRRSDDLQRIRQENWLAAPRVASSIIGAALDRATASRPRRCFSRRARCGRKRFSLSPGDEQSIDRLLAQGSCPDASARYIPFGGFKTRCGCLAVHHQPNFPNAEDSPDFGSTHTAFLFSARRHEIQVRARLMIMTKNAQKAASCSA